MSRSEPSHGSGSSRTARRPRECVQDYPRPPRLEEAGRHVVVTFAGVVLADTRDALRVETSHPPVYYVPPCDVALDLLSRTRQTAFCEWKGTARYHDVRVGARSVPRAAWSYPDPTPAFARLRDHLAFYPGRMEGCFVDGEPVRAQPGDFYGGWITSELVGPFKGVPGSQGW